MEKWEEILTRYARFLELEGEIPELEEKDREKTAALKDRKWDMDWKELEARNLDNPNFFQRLLGKNEEKREAAWQLYREAAADYEREKREAEALQQQIFTKKEELAGLAYYADAGLQLFDHYEIPVERLQNALAPAMVKTANRILDALVQARRWMQEDARYKGVRSENRKLEFLSKASAETLRLRCLLEKVEVDFEGFGGYLKYPESYITAPTSEFKQLDRLNGAMEQVRALRGHLESF